MGGFQGSLGSNERATPKTEVRRDVQFWIQHQQWLSEQLADATATISALKEEMEIAGARLVESVPPGSESALRGEWTDWTVKNGRSNSSDIYNHLSAEVAKIIRNSAADLMAGRSELIGGLIMAHLAHECHILPAPNPTAHPEPATGSQDLPSPKTQGIQDIPESCFGHFQDIGVYDYDSLVACLRLNYEKVFADAAIRHDSQDLIQLMTAEIQSLRKTLAMIRNEA